MRDLGSHSRSGPEAPVSSVPTSPIVPCGLSRALTPSSQGMSPCPHPPLILALPLDTPWNICQLGWAWEAGSGLLSPVGAGSFSPCQLGPLGLDRSLLSPSLGTALLAPVWHSWPSLAKGLCW